MEKKYVIAENCPADAIREYIENMFNAQKEYVLNGKEVPEELLIPSVIEISPENINFLLDSKLVTHIGMNKDDEVVFYWEESDIYPALELKVKYEDDGKIYLTYIREEASKDKPAFEWNRNNQENKGGTIVIYKRDDGLQDLFDIEEEMKHRK